MSEQRFLFGFGCYLGMIMSLKTVTTLLATLPSPKHNLLILGSLIKPSMAAMQLQAAGPFWRTASRITSISSIRVDLFEL
jgi:hypothetical protein